MDAPLNPDQSDPTVLEEWQRMTEETPEDIRRCVSSCVSTHGSALADFFYRVMMEHPVAASFLNHVVVENRLRGSMQRWLEDIYSEPMQDIGTLVARQHKVGEVHARIHLPIHLVTRGARLLKHKLFEFLIPAFHDPERLRHALAYTGQVMDMALEIMSAAYEHNHDRDSHTDEAFRLFSLGQNISVERERQRSVLLEWGQSILFTLHRQSGPITFPRLGVSEFGLWFMHKATVLFENSSELDSIKNAMQRIDKELLPQLENGISKTEDLRQILRQMQEELDHIRYQLNTLFERQLELENGRDTLTRLLNRRFLPTVLNREILLARNQKLQFALLLLDIDHFKQVNDVHGHEAGDAVLQQASMLIMNTVRSGDFVFRYGGEEILIVMVDVTPEMSSRVAEKLRQRFESADFRLPNNHLLHTTISIGLAMFDGHPDCQHLIRRADEAMYSAKHTGRNRVVVAN